MFLYSIALAGAAALLTPWWAWKLLRTAGYREWLAQRLRPVSKELHAYVQGKRVVWVHAVSVGEVLAATRLVKELEAALGEGWVVVVSTTTQTGQKLAKERLGAARAFYYPLDFAWAVRAYLRVLKPAAVVLMESELWPRMLYECRRCGVPVAVANARVSDRSFARALRVRGVWRRVLGMVTVWLAQSEEDGRRLVAMGAREGAVWVVGNLKYDVRAPKESRVAELIKEAAAGRPIVVAGSTVEDQPRGEDSYLIHAWEGPVKKRHNALLVLAPRHPERFEIAHSMAIEFPTLKATELLSGSKSDMALSPLTPAEENRGVEIIVLDTIGDLAGVYSIADIAFVGGSLVKRGGHNPLEPAQFGVPVVMGPSYENFRGIVERLKAAGAISILGVDAGLSAASAKNTGFGRDDSSEVVSKYALKDELEAELVRLLTDREAARAMGERGRLVFEEQQGATGRAVEAIVSLVRDGAVAQ